MHEPKAMPPGGRLARRRDLALLLVLILSAAATHLWLLRHTTVPARDGVSFIHFAWQFEHLPWRTALASADQHPGYPLAVLLLSWPVRHLSHAGQAEVMAQSAQLVSVLASCLLVLPVFSLGRRIFDAQVGFWAALLFQSLPVSARVTADALSEATFLLAVAVTLVLAIRALCGGSPGWFALVGVGGAIAYLVRPEGALTIATAGLVLGVMQTLPAWRRPWRRVLVCAGSMAVPALLLAGPYMLLIGGFTVKPTGQEVLKMGIPAADDGPSASVPAPAEPLAASLLGVWSADARGGPWWGLWAVGVELTRASYYVVWPAALVGLYWFRGRLRDNPAAWVVLALCLLQTAAVWRVAMRLGYVSERHVLVILLGLLFWAVAVLRELPGRLLPHWTVSTPRAVARWYATPAVWSSVLPLGLLAAALPKTLQPLHGNEGRHRVAGRWLAAHAGPEDVIVDPFRWAGYYAGRAFMPDRPPGVVPPGAAQYVVLEASRSQHSKELIEAAARELARHGRLVCRVPPGHRARRQNAGDVEIYRVPPADPSP